MKVTFGIQKIMEAYGEIMEMEKEDIFTRR